MAQLSSPGVAVSVIDDSIYAAAGQGTVPLIILATEQDKTVPAGTAIASKTTQATAGYPVLLSSQRELSQLFGTPIFKSLNGTPQHGHELNEYGLLAAHSYLGVANSAYVIRADIDLGALEARVDMPMGPAANGQYWLDLTSTKWGLFKAAGTSTAGSASTWWEEKTVWVRTEDTSAIPGHTLEVGDVVVDVFTTENKYRVVVAKDAGSYVFGELVNGSDRIVYAQPHYDYPTPTVAEIMSYWFKTTTPNNGFDPVVKKYNATTGKWDRVTVAAYGSDADAESALGTKLAAGSVYAKVVDTAAKFQLRRYDGSAWDVLSYDASYTAPTGDTPDQAMWFNSDLVADIYVKEAAGWTPVTTVTVDTEEPTNPAIGAAWVDTNDMDNYPVIKVYDGDKWVLRNNADQTTPNGVVFADLTPNAADDSNDGVATPWDEVQTPDPAVYPAGTLLWNSMVSTYNVKQYSAATQLWHTISGNYATGPKAGAMYSGRKAVRQVVVKAMQEAVAASDRLREETVKFSLIAAPGYPELADEMLTLNVDRKETAFVIIDTPFRLEPRLPELIDWVTGVNAGTNGEDGLVTKTYEAAVYYPSVLTTNLDGSDVVVPPSHAVLRTIAYSDNVSYPWFAPAGLTRGVVTNATNFGYVNVEGEFQALGLNHGQRDVLYQNGINPLVNFPGQGLVVWGQKTLSPVSSALDRVNVARLVAYLRERFDPLARPFIFEPNDTTTRANVRSVFARFLGDIMQKRGVYDFVVVCDETNNTPARIDANELWIDVAIEPVKAAEMIYIPIRLVNTGALSN